MTAINTCYFCNHTFTQKHNLEKHLNNKKCKSKLLNNWDELNAMLQESQVEKIQLQTLQTLQELQVEKIQELQEIQEIKEIQLKFDSIFQGRKSEIRITQDKYISIFDFIRVVSGQDNPRKIWSGILQKHKNEILEFFEKRKFPGSQKLTPVINVQGIIKLLSWLPGELDKQFRSKSAETIIRYLGGDLTLQKIEEIQEIQVEREIQVEEIQVEEIQEIQVEEIQEIQVEQIQEIQEEQIQEIQVEQIQLKFDGIFQGRESEIRITQDKKISVFDFIRVVGGQKNPKSTWERLQEKYRNEVVPFCDHFNFSGQGQKLTPVINVQGMVKLLFWLPGELAKQFRSKSAETMIRYLGGDLTLLELHIEKIQEIQLQTPQELQVEKIQLKFDGIFQGRESEIRITQDKKISVFDFIKVVGGQENPRDTWNNIKKKYKKEVVEFLDNLKFPGAGQKLTPVVNVQGMVKLLFWLPGELAKQFRSKSAETMIRYLGGDLTLIDEIKAIDNEHRINPNNIAQVFRNEVNNNSLLNFNQVNNSKQLLSHFGSKTNVLYMLQFYLNEKWYLKFGIVNVRPFFERFNEHLSELGPDLCVMDVFQSPDITLIESEHKSTIFFKQHKSILPKKNGLGNHTEIYELSETLTYQMIQNEILKVAGERITDPPPSYSKAIESSELTKQIECVEITKQKQIECVEMTKQKQIECVEMTKQCEIELKKLQVEFEMKKLEFEMMKYNSKFA